MTTKKFLVTFVSDDQTRWLDSDEIVARFMKRTAEEIGVALTCGSKPLVEVVIEEKKEEGR